jgi:hypothetical protein
MDAELVMSRTDEDLHWALEWPHKVTVYAKGKRVDGPAHWNTVHLDNIGREAHSYLFHILNRWDSLPEVTVFLLPRDDPCKINVLKDLACKADYETRTAQITMVKDWDDGGRLIHDPFPADMKRAEFPFVHWFDRLFELDVNEMPGVRCCTGAMAVPRWRIRARCRRVYEYLMDTIPPHPYPEEVHYLQRAWLYLWGM